MISRAHIAIAGFLLSLLQGHPTRHASTRTKVVAIGRVLVLAALAGLTIDGLPAHSAAASARAEMSIIQASDHDELNEKFCAADPNVDHIIVLPASLFVDSRELICESDAYKLYRIIEHDDPDDFEYYLDPPFGAEDRLGCDGKAGKTMETIAVNCRPLKGSAE